MSSSGQGPGVRKFWKALANGAEVDVKAIFEEHPDEALELAGAIQDAATLEESVSRERMWLARAHILNRSGEKVTLGTLLRTSREDAGLSTGALASRVKEREVGLLVAAIEQLEADRVKITNVNIPGLWLALAEILQIDRHRLVAMIQGALSGPQTAQRFTRMERGASAATREQFLGSELSSKPREDTTSYIDRVRVELGLPSSPTDAIQ